MENILRKFIYFVLILSLAIPVSTVFEAITFNEVYAQQKERNHLKLEELKHCQKKLVLIS